MDLGISGKRALVFASSQGIGKAVARSLVEEGARVALASRSEEKLKAAAEEIGAVAYFPVDLSEEGAGARLVAATQEALGGIDILVTNAGGPPAGTFLEIETEQWHRGFQSLFLSVREALSAALPLMMKQQWGRVVMITSLAGKEPVPGLTISNALRAGLHGLVNSVSKEVAGDGVTINAILPGYTDTERLQELAKDTSSLLPKIPAGRLGKPEELGSIAAYLCSEQAAFITGQALVFDGGSSSGI